ERLTQNDNFDPNRLEFTNLTFESENILLQKEKAEVALKILSFREKSGFTVRNLAFNLGINDTGLSLSKLNINTLKSDLNGDLQLTYQSINKLLSETEETTVALNIPKLNIALEELFFFQPQLSENKYLNILAKKPLSGNINAKGTLAKINIPNTHIL